ncbi:DNA fragmentation factor subunit alpha [Scaptodrosophila lebanonensis]|uniref:DNAation factor subunit alpha n=1 Tax=Drosophila lebanonensis TaxID=7225 RepID=A0A6J2TY39_DROLE|nr:DNA fragmentation factor subunit alpha [Scaptodrosophila lebanonensis]
MPNAMETESRTSESKKPFKVKDVTRNIKKAVCAATLEEIRAKVAEKFDKCEQQPTIHLDSDGTEIDDEEYFRTLDENTELVAVFAGEHWIDPTHYVTITTQRATANGTGACNGENGGDTIDANHSESARIQQLVGQLQNNLCNVSVMNDADLDSLSNMDPNSLVDITGKEFMEQLKDAGRPLCAKRNAEDRLNLLKLLKAGAIFCSERYPEDAEAIDREIGRQLNEAEHAQTTTTTNASNARTIEVVQCDNQNTTITITVADASSSNTASPTTICTATMDNTNNPKVANDAANAANAANANGDI